MPKISSNSFIKYGINMPQQIGNTKDKTLMIDLDGTLLHKKDNEKNY